MHNTPIVSYGARQMFQTAIMAIIDKYGNASAARDL